MEGALAPRGRHEAKIAIPLDPKTRLEFVRTLIEAAKIDGVLHPAERKLIGGLAMNVGFPLDRLKDLLDES